MLISEFNEVMEQYHQGNESGGSANLVINVPNRISKSRILFTCLEPLM